MVSQHPDNASKPFWHTDAYIRDHDEVKECYFAFSKLNVAEYKWDWEGNHSDLKRAGCYLNKNVLFSLSKKSQGWREIQEDVKIIEDYLGQELEPETPQEKAHLVFSESIYERFTKGIEMTDLIEEAAILRRSLG